MGFTDDLLDNTKILQGRIDRLERALNLALSILSPFEPPDSRAVSGEFVACASVACGNEDTRVMAFIDEALAARSPDPVPTNG